MELPPEVVALQAIIDELQEAGPSAWADGKTLCALKRQVARLVSIVDEASHEFDTWGEWANDGARTAPSWLAHACHEPIGVARRGGARGRGLKELPLVAEAFAQGEINSSHVDALLRVRNPRTQHVMTRDEKLLVDQATTLSFSDFSRSLAYWEQMADPDGVEEDALAQRDRPDAYLVQ